MTLFDLMPSVWLILAFVFSCFYFLSGRLCFLYGAGGAFFALCPAVLSFHIYVQTFSFFAYMVAVFAAARIAKTGKRQRCGAVALTKIDADGGYILYKGSVRNAYCRDPLAVYRTGDVLQVTLCSDGILRADRI